jgi:hypothetical protein
MLNRPTEQNLAHIHVNTILRLGSNPPESLVLEERKRARSRYAPESANHDGKKDNNVHPGLPSDE